MRTPKIGDWVRHPAWINFYPITRIDGPNIYVHRHVWPVMQARECIFRDAEAPVIDWSKPVRRIHDRPDNVCRVLCTDAPGDQSVIVMDNAGVIERVSQDGRLYPDHDVRYENVPPPKEERTFDIVMHRSKRNGMVHVGKHPVGWVPNENEVIARKTVTITEGEGL